MDDFLMLESILVFGSTLSHNICSFTIAIRLKLLCSNLFYMVLIRFFNFFSP